MNTIIDNKLEKLFPPAASFAGYIILIVGLLIFVYNLIAGLVISVFGGFMSFTYSGIQIDLESRRFRKYICIFGIKHGVWITLNNYPYITILHKNIVTTAYSRSNRPATTSDENYFDICILNDTQQEKIIIKRLKSKEQAIREVKEFAEKMNVKFVDYNPLRSKKTKEISRR